MPQPTTQHNTSASAIEEATDSHFRYLAGCQFTHTHTQKLFQLRCKCNTLPLRWPHCVAEHTGPMHCKRTTTGAQQQEDVVLSVPAAAHHRELPQICQGSGRHPQSFHSSQNKHVGPSPLIFCELHTYNRGSVLTGRWTFVRNHKVGKTPPATVGLCQVMMRDQCGVCVRAQHCLQTIPHQSSATD